MITGSCFLLRSVGTSTQRITGTTFEKFIFITGGEMGRRTEAVGSACVDQSGDANLVSFRAARWTAHTNRRLKRVKRKSQAHFNYFPCVVCLERFRVAATCSMRSEAQPIEIHDASNERQLRFILNSILRLVCAAGDVRRFAPPLFLLQAMPTAVAL